MNFFDWHCDTLSVLDAGLEGGVSNKILSRFEKAVQVFAIYTPDSLSDSESYERAMRQFKIFEALDFKHKIVSIESSRCLINGAKTLQEFNARGVFLFSLTHNAENRFAHGCASEGGLKEEGKNLLRAAAELGMTLDVSHLSKQAFYEAVDFYGGPVIASHSCFDAVYPHRRNLTDEMAKLIAERGGLIGINIYPKFLGGASLDDVVRHIEHGAELGLERNIAFGCDFDGIDTIPEEMKNYGDIAGIYTKLLEKGFSESLCRDIYYNSSYKFLERNGYVGFLQHTEQ